MSMSERTWPTSPGDPGMSEYSPALQQLFADVTAPAHEDELAGLVDVLTAFAGREVAVDPHTPPRWNRTKRLLPSLLALKVLLAAAGAAAAGGFAVAAATDSLPRPLQTFAHDVLGAPAPHRDGHSSDPQQPGSHGSSGGPESPNSSGNPPAPGVGATGVAGAPRAARTPGGHDSPTPSDHRQSSPGKGKPSQGNGGGSGHS